MKKFSFFIFIIFLSYFAYSQNTVISEEVSPDLEKNTYGKNKKNYFHSYFNIKFSSGFADDGTGVKYGLSNDIDLGIRYKFKICNFYAIGFDATFFSFEGFSLKNDVLSKMIIENYEQMDIKKIALHFIGLGLEFYNRFNFGKRGNSIGKYLDVGGYTKYNYSKKFIYKIETNDFYKKAEISYSGLKFMNDFEYGLSARIGLNKNAITVKYRFSDYFNNSTILKDLPELPRLHIGFEIGLF